MLPDKLPPHGLHKRTTRSVCWCLVVKEKPSRRQGAVPVTFGFAVVLHVCTHSCETLLCRKRKVLLEFGPIHVSVLASGLTREVRTVRRDLRGCRKF